LDSNLARSIRRQLDIVRQPLDIVPLAVGSKEKLGLLRFIAINLFDRIRNQQRDTVIQLQGNRYHVRTCSGELSPFPEIYRNNVYEKVPGFAPQYADVILDVGANTGIFSIKQASRGARIYAFEPHPQVYSRLLRNVAENSLAGTVSTFHVALGSRPGRAALKTKASTVVTQVEFDDAGSVRVESLDGTIPALGLEKVDLLKLDVEGAEAEILAGGTHVLNRVGRIVMEYHGQERLRQVRSILDEAEFKEVYCDESYAYFINQGLT
jgi:FkbM family methyltransferase